MVPFGILERKKVFKLYTLKVVTVPHEWWLLTEGSKYSGLETFGILENCLLRRGERFQEVVATRGLTVFALLKV